MLGRGLAGRLGLVVVAAALAAGLVAPGVASAGFPGVNGQIAFTRSPIQTAIVATSKSPPVPGAQSRQILSAPGAGQIFTMDPSGSGQANVSRSSGDDRLPNWSPDGKLIAFTHSDPPSQSTQIWVMNADGSGKRKVTDGPSDSQPAFSADGSRIFFVRVIGGVVAQIWVVGTDGTNPHVLFAPSNDNGFYTQPTASPDGSRIAFFFFDFSHFTEHLVVANADGSGSPQEIPNQTATEVNSSPDWSPDSRSIVFVRGSLALAPTQIWVIGADGSNARQLTNPPAGQCDEAPFFSPDGQQVVFAHASCLTLNVLAAVQPQSNIWAVPAGGGTAHALTTQTDSLDFDPTWRPQPNLVSSAQVPACTRTGAIGVTVSDSSGFISPPSAALFQLDGGAVQSAATGGGNPGQATLTVPVGTHSLTFWGQDAAGYEEASHHTVPVLVDRTRPRVRLIIEQHRSRFVRGQRASLTITASDNSSGLVRNPARRHVRLSTARLGVHVVRATAVDRCGNRTTALLRYRVLPARVSPPPRFTG